MIVIPSYRNKHWLCGALLSLILFLILFSLLYLFYATRTMDCHIIEGPSDLSSQFLNSSSDWDAEKLLLNSNSGSNQTKTDRTNDRETYINNNNRIVHPPGSTNVIKRIWTFYGVKQCIMPEKRIDNLKLETKECPIPYDSAYCFNGGECSLINYGSEDGEFVPLCRCAPNFHGQRCEYVFDTDVYEFPLDDGEPTTSAKMTSESESLDQHVSVERAGLNALAIFSLFSVLIAAVLVYGYLRVTNKPQNSSQKILSCSNV